MPWPEAGCRRGVGGFGKMLETRWRHRAHRCTLDAPKLCRVRTCKHVRHFLRKCQTFSPKCLKFLEIRIRHNLGAFNILEGSKGASPAASAHARAHKAPTYAWAPPGRRTQSAAHMPPRLPATIAKKAFIAKKKLYRGI